MNPSTLIWMSDTQGYSSSYPETLAAMTQWIVDHKTDLNIQYVLQTGDIVNDTTREKEWQNATAAFDTLIGQVPLIAIAGNHDIGGVVHNYKAFHEMMLRQNYESYPTFGGEQPLGRGRYDLVTIGHEDYILLGVGYSVQRTDAAWLDGVLKQYPDRTAILLAHWYLELDDQAFSADSAVLHDIVAANPNVRYVLCGHRHGMKRVAELYDDNNDGTDDRTVQAIMVDYQALPDGGSGDLMIITIDLLRGSSRSRRTRPCWTTTTFSRTSRSKPTPSRCPQSPVNKPSQSQTTNKRPALPGVCCCVCSRYSEYWQEQLSAALTG